MVLLMDDLRSLDRPWSLDKIRLLLHGEVEVDGDLWTGQSAYELRCRSEQGGDFAELMCDVAQLDLAIRRGIQRDHEVRVAMLLATRGGHLENEVEDLLGSKRPGYAMLERGAELVRRQQSGEYSRLRRVRAHKGESDQPVCWKCLKVDVPRPGDYCGCIEREQKSKRSHTGPGSTYDPTSQPDPSSMSEEARAAEIALLTATQDRGPIPGGEHFRKRVQLIGHLHDPEDIRRNDAYYRQHGHRMSDRGGRCD
jgi:hypothetical protein